MLIGQKNLDEQEQAAYIGGVFLQLLAEASLLNESRFCLILISKFPVLYRATAFLSLSQMP